MNPCRDCGGRGGFDVAGGPGACARCGQVGEGPPQTVGQLASILATFPADAPLIDAQPGSMMFLGIGVGLLARLQARPRLAKVARLPGGAHGSDEFVEAHIPPFEDGPEIIDGVIFE